MMHFLWEIFEALLFLIIIHRILAFAFVGQRLKRKPGFHTDWWWLLRLIPRRWTSYGVKRVPLKIFGNATLVVTVKGTFPKPIPDRGEWHVSLPPYFALQTKDGWHFRIGDRYDDIQGEYEIPSLKIGRY